MSDATAREWRFYIDDMIDAARKVLAYTDGFDQPAFVASGLNYDATVRNLEIIGEAATHVPDDVRDSHPQIPWRQIVATRHRLIHGYLGIDNDTLWSIIRDDIPALRDALEKLQARLLLTMEFRIADTFADSLARLTHDKQKLVKTTAFDLQLNPASPGLSFHKLDRGKDKNFWSMRVGSDIGLIVHRSESSLLLCYVDHHDSWKSLGVDVRGRSRTLRVNYRTSHQIRSQADRLLGPSVTDVDGNTEDRSDTVSVFNGPPPRIQILDGADEEIAVVGRWLAEGVRAGTLPHEIGVFVRSEAQIGRAEEALRLADLPFHVLDDRVATEHDHVSVSTMPLAKGLEFRAVVVMACDDEVIPLQERIETVGDDGDLQEVYDTERQLLYVACTRARDRLLVTGTAPSSEFLDDLEGK